MSLSYYNVNTKKKTIYSKRKTKNKLKNKQSKTKKNMKGSGPVVSIPIDKENKHKSKDNYDFKYYIDLIKNNPQYLNILNKNISIFIKRQYKHIIIYDDYLKQILSKTSNINNISNKADLFDKIKITTEPIFDYISKVDYPTGDPRDRHGAFNHMRSLSFGIYIFNNFNINFGDLGITDMNHKFCVLMATYFVAIGRIGEGRRDFGNRKLIMTKDCLNLIYPNTSEYLINFKNYGQNLHQFVSAFMYLSIMKKIMNKKYYEIIELCAFSIQWYHNQNDDSLEFTNDNSLNNEHKTFFFLHYF